MKYLLARITGLRSDILVGDNSEDLLAGVQFFVNERRRVVLNGVEDTVSFSADFTDAELPREAHKRVLELLKRDGWVLYERKD